MKTIVKVLVEYNKKFLLIRRSKTAPRRPLQWDYPGGFTESKDHKKDILRELKEETGLKSRDCRFVCEVIEKISGEKIEFQLYYCTVNDDRVTLSYEHDAVIWVPFSELNAYNTYPVHQKAVQKAAELLPHYND